MRLALLKKSLFAALFVLLFFIAGGRVRNHRPGNFPAIPKKKASATAKPISDEQKARITALYGNLPLAFEKNVGQSDSQVQYLARGKGYELFLAPHEALLSLQQSGPNFSSLLRTSGATAMAQAARPRKTSFLRLQFQGANDSSRITGMQQLPGKTNYFTGSNPKEWHTNVPSYARVQYSDLYPGINAAFYGSSRRLEYDFVVSPGADPRRIALHIEGARTLKVNASGSVIANLDAGEVELQKPVAYQMVSGERREIAANYVLSGTDKLRFDVPRFDPHQPLIIDPVLNYSTFLGGSVPGSSSPGDSGSAVAVDAAGDAFIVGTTFSTTFPVNNAIFPAPGAGITQGAAFVTELNPTGTAEIYSTYLSGDTGEFGQGITLDTLGNAYVTGGTFSTNYPTTSNGFSQTSPPITNPNGTAFLTKINPTGSALAYSTLLGGTNGDFGASVAADAAGNAYVTGFTNSAAGAAPTLFTIKGGFQTTLNPNGGGNAFLIRIDTTQSAANSLIYSTYLGGTGTGAGSPHFAETGFGVAVDALKSVYVVGTTTSTDFPVTPATAFLASAPANVTNGAAFVAKIDTTTTGANSKVYATYLDGPVSSPATSGDFANSVALGPGNVAYVVGQTFSTFYVTPNSYQSPASALGVAFLSLVDATKSGSASVPYSARIGGNSNDSGNAIRVDATGNAYVSGIAGSPNFPVTPGALQSTRPVNNADAFVLELNPGSHGTADLLYSSYFGGSNADTFGFGIALDTLKNVYITGSTGASDFPVFSTGTPFQSSIGSGDVAAFVSKLTLVPTLAFGPPCAFNLAVTPSTSCALAFGNQIIHTPSAAMTFTLTNNTSSNIVLTYPPVLSGTNSSDFAASGTVSGSASACSAAPLAPGASCGFGVIFTPSVMGAETASLPIAYTYNNGLSATAAASQVVALSGTSVTATPAVTFTPAGLSFGGQLVTTTSTAQAVTVKNTGTATLTLTAAPSLSGTNAADFAIATGTTCVNGSTIAPNATCVINVTFAPPAAAAGARSATLSIADNAAGSPQTVPLSGTAWDFTISAQPLTVTRGANGTITVTVAGVGGFTGAVTLSCTASIPRGSCASPGSAVTTPGTGTVTILTTGAVPPPASRKTPPFSAPQILLLLLAILLLCGLPATRRLRTRLGLAGAAAVLVLVAGCSSAIPTTVGTYPVTITGTSGAVSHSTTATVTVN